MVGTQPDIIVSFAFLLFCIALYCWHGCLISCRNVYRTHTLMWIFFHSRFQVAEIFSKLEKIRTDCSVEDYSVTQTSLDHVFIRFAKRQSDSLDAASVLQGPGMDSTSLAGSSVGTSSQMNLIIWVAVDNGVLGCSAYGVGVVYPSGVLYPTGVVFSLGNMRKIVGTDFVPPKLNFTVIFFILYSLL